MMNIVKPTFVVDKQVCLGNIEKMAQKAALHGMRFRPHFKTHQSAAIGEWFRQAGVTAITVSSVSMAKYFALHGWKDITVAFPVNILEIGDINDLAGRIALNLLIENEISLSFLAEHLTKPVGIYTEIDTGYHRSGIDFNKTRRIEQLLDIIRKNRLMAFKGFLTHTGQTYTAGSREEMISLHADALMQLRSLKYHFLSCCPGLEISFGDTPACSVCDHWDDVDEIRPGNFIFYDFMQLQLGSCHLEEIAAKVICPVVSKNIMRSEAVIYGGAVHLSKEFVIGPNGKRWYGAVLFRHPETGHSEISGDVWVANLSQEHGIIRGSFQEIQKLQPGDLLEIIPVHSCLAADLAGNYYTTEGEGIEKFDKSSI